MSAHIDEVDKIGVVYYICAEMLQGRTRTLLNYGSMSSVYRALYYRLYLLKMHRINACKSIMNGLGQKLIKSQQENLKSLPTRPSRIYSP